MLTFHFYKIASQWYMDDPNYLDGGGNPALLDVVGGMNDLLEFFSQGRSAIQLVAALTPFEHADKMVLIESSGGGTGGYYRLQLPNGQVEEFWLNELVYYYFNELPSTIYVSFR